MFYNNDISCNETNNENKIVSYIYLTKITTFLTLFLIFVNYKNILIFSEKICFKIIMKFLRFKSHYKKMTNKKNNIINQEIENYNDFNVSFINLINETKFINYTYKNNEYIVIVHNKNSTEWSYTIDEWTKILKEKLKEFNVSIQIESANLVTKTNKNYDIYDEIKKYLGPNNDFHDFILSDENTIKIDKIYIQNNMNVFLKETDKIIFTTDLFEEITFDINTHIRNIF